MKKFAIYIFSAVLIIGAAFGLTEYLSGTTYVLGAGSTIFVDFVKGSEGETERIYLTHEEEEELKLILLEAERKNKKIKFAPLAQEDIKYYIHLTNEKQGQLFITLGNVNVVYRNSEKGGFEIVDPEGIIAKIDALLAEKGK